MSHKLHGYKWDPKDEGANQMGWAKTHDIPEGYLDPTCKDCKHKVIGNLVGEHFLRVVGVPRERFDFMVREFPRGIVEQLGNSPALETMERRLYRVAENHSEALDQKDLAFASYYVLRPWEPLYAEPEREEANA